MKPTEILVNEHRLIEQVLACLERMAERCEAERRLEPGPARDAIVFLRGFSQRCHESRVESRLLPAIEELGISLEHCQACSMRERRSEGRSHVDAMDAALEPASRGDPEALRTFAEHARAYIDLLLDYIANQEDCLFPMIARSLPEADRTRLSKALGSGTAAERDQHDCDTYVALANRLADHFNVPRAVPVRFHGGWSGEGDGR